MKKLLVIILILIVGGILAVSFSLDSIIKKGIETVGSQATGATVKVRDVNISLLSGKGKIRGIFIGNPKGFKTESAFTLNEVRVALDVKSAFSDRIIVNEIFIDTPDITYEKGGRGDNIKTILNNIKSFQGGTKSTPVKKQEKSSEGETKIQIDKFDVINGNINMSLTALQGEKLALAMPDIHMKDIGKKGGGASMADVMEQIFAKVNTNIGTAVTGSLQKDIGKKIEKAVGGKAGKSLDKLKGMFGK
jgi:uncharacterized protein involved in outer membrane biogenesis